MLDKENNTNTINKGLKGAVKQIKQKNETAMTIH